VSGRERGEHREWYSDGQIKSEQSFRDGLLEGVARKWFPGGRLYREATYEAGVEEGSQRMWYTDGSLRANYVVRDGRRFGLIGSKACVEETST
jgi:antitoxin component YwqK of YwqJK toxin-antitoxin module